MFPQPAMLSHLHKVLEHTLRTSIQITLEVNPLRILSVRRQAKSLNVTLHPHFLTAPLNVVHFLAQYILGDRAAAARLKAYILSRDEHFEDPLDVKPSDGGIHHDLKELFTRVRARYFPELATCSVQWFAKVRNRPQRSITLGLYVFAQRLIKVHRLLDHPLVPSLFVEFVLYHEALHMQFPPRIGTRARLSVHTSEFKRAEKRFEGYRECIVWRRAHLWSLVQNARDEKTSTNIAR